MILPALAVKPVLLTVFFIGSLFISNIEPGPEAPKDKLVNAAHKTFAAAPFDYSKMND